MTLSALNVVVRIFVDEGAVCFGVLGGYLPKVASITLRPFRSSFWLSGV